MKWFLWVCGYLHVVHGMEGFEMCLFGNIVCVELVCSTKPASEDTGRITASSLGNVHGGLQQDVSFSKVDGAFQGEKQLI